MTDGSGEGGLQGPPGKEGKMINLEELRKELKEGKLTVFKSHGGLYLMDTETGDTIQLIVED